MRSDRQAENSLAKSAAKPRRKIKRLRLDDNVRDEEVGYGKPPRAHQFKPGESGNPNGRPKGRKNEITMLTEMLYRVISVRQGERQLRMPVIQAMFHRFLEDSLKGNIKAARFLLDRLNAVASEAGQQAELNEDDQAVLKAFTEDFLSSQKGQKA